MYGMAVVWNLIIKSGPFLGQVFDPDRRLDVKGIVFMAHHLSGEGL
jgi:hypothetical protein